MPCKTLYSGVDIPNLVAVFPSITPKTFAICFFIEKIGGEGGYPSPNIIFHKKRCANALYPENLIRELFKTSKKFKIR